MTKTIEISVEIGYETERAYKVTDGYVDAWLPKSQLKTDDICGVGKTVTFEMPEWLAQDKGFI